jgi:hypothetical protein
LISLFLLVQHSRGKVDRFDVGTQFTHDGATAADLLGGAR